ncbi:CapA family protein [Saliphagus sp. LR7]|uniref:CapA family protein n=1 Tax=Saliphagus sp. LR7 TaxID=2282654 RepID=UPI0013003F19|nr:CapA family protein [Saliphagus sp. LR7]
MERHGGREGTDPPRIDLTDGERAADPGADETWTMLVAGDYALAREEPPTAETTISPAIRDRILDAEYSIVNFEAPVVGEGAQAVPKSGPTVENPPEAPEAVAESGFDAATLANNHVGDFGPGGVESTVEALEAEGLETVGVGPDFERAYEPLAVARGGDSIAVVNVCEREFNVAGESSAGAAWLAHRRAREAIRDADRAHESVIAVVHAGVEYAPFPAPELQDLLREFVDIGADMVIGHHPHVPQGWERYGGGAICYSLGNFLFDGMADAENTAWGLVAELEFRGSEPVGIDLVPVETVEGVVHPFGEAERRERSHDRADRLAYLRRIAEIAAENPGPYWQEVAIRLFYERYSNWLHTGCGLNVPRARANPHDPAAQRPLWDVEARRREVLTLLTVVRMESHRWLMTEALAVLTGETEDLRTPEITEEAQLLLSQAERE